MLIILSSHLLKLSIDKEQKNHINSKPKSKRNLTEFKLKIGGDAYERLMRTKIRNEAELLKCRRKKERRIVTVRGKT